MKHFEKKPFENPNITTDNLTKEQRRKTMQSIRSKGTVAEKTIARELRRHKIYFAQNVPTITGKPDIVFRRKKIAVFIDSDFWHGNPKRFIMPKSNVEYWEAKIERNINRDREVNKMLKKEGWKVIRIWEYDVKHNCKKCMDKIVRALEKNESQVGI